MCQKLLLAFQGNHPLHVGIENLPAKINVAGFQFEVLGIQNAGNTLQISFVPNDWMARM